MYMILLINVVFCLIFREWRDVSFNQEKYLIQLMPPGDILTEVIRTIVSTQNITSAAIMYDESFGNYVFNITIFPYL